MKDADEQASSRMVVYICTWQGSMGRARVRVIIIYTRVQKVKIITLTMTILDASGTVV